MDLANTSRPVFVATTLTLCSAWALAGCAYFRPPAGYSSGGGGGSPSSSDANLSADELACIEDAEDGDSQTLTRQGRGGYLYTFADELGTRITPGSSEFVVTAGGVEDTGYALRMTGTTSEAGGDVYAGMGFSFTYPEGPYNATGYCGIEFVARKAAGSSGFLRFKVPDVNTTPEGGQCKECYNDFGVDFEVEEEWVHYVVDFDDLNQENGWGDPQPAVVSVHALWGIQWQVTTRGAGFDIWIDDIKFTSCSESPSEVE